MQDIQELLLFNLAIQIVYFERVFFGLDLVGLFDGAVQITHILEKLCFQRFDLTLYVGHLSLFEILEKYILCSPDIDGILFLFVKNEFNVVIGFCTQVHIDGRILE